MTIVPVPWTELSVRDVLAIFKVDVIVIVVVLVWRLLLWVELSHHIEPFAHNLLLFIGEISI